MMVPVYPVPIPMMMPALPLYFPLPAPSTMNPALALRTRREAAAKAQLEELERKERASEATVPEVIQKFFIFTFIHHMHYISINITMISISL